MKKVSLVIPCYNVKGYRLDRMMNSIQSQDYSNIEVILVDDGSSNDTFEKLSAWVQKFRDSGHDACVFSKAHGGCASAINVGLQHSTGDYICFPDADDQMLDGYISKMADFLDMHNQLNWVRCDAEKVNDTAIETDCTYINSPNAYYDRLFERYLSFQINHVVWIMMVRREYLINCIPSFSINENAGSQEWQLLLPLSFYGDSGYIDMPLYRYFIYEDSFYHSHKHDPSKLKKYYELHTENKLIALKRLPLDKRQYEWAMDLLTLGEVKQYKRHNVESSPQTTNERLFYLCLKYLKGTPEMVNLDELDDPHTFDRCIHSIELCWNLANQ